MHDVIGSLASRRTAGAAAGVLLAGAALLATPGMALASTTVAPAATGTAISGTQERVLPFRMAMLTVSVSVTAQSGSQAPAGDVVVGDGRTTCHATLTPGSGVVSSGSCELRFVAFGRYTLKASYTGSATFGSSDSANYPVVVGLAPKFTVANPALRAVPGSDYRYKFRASGDPAPGYALAPGAPKWLGIDPVSGRLSGRVPFGVTSFGYSVVASNGVASVTAGPFAVRVSPFGHGRARVTTQLDCPRAVVSGHGGRCTLTVTDRSPFRAVNVTAAIALPPQLHARFCWTCRLNGNIASFRLGTLGPWQSRSVSVLFTARFQPARWDRHPIRVTVAGLAQWGQRVWWQRPPASFTTTRVIIFPR